MKIGVLLDATGSMAGDTLRTIDGFNEYILGLKGDGRTREAELTLAAFNSDIGVKIVHKNEIVFDLPPLTQKEYICQGATPLYDAIGQTIGVIERAATDREKVLFIITTDGEENASSKYDRDAIRKLIKDKEAAGWTFVFLGADIDAWQAQETMGLAMAAGNTMSYGKSDTVATMRGLAGQTVAYASSGAQSTDQFFGGSAPSGAASGSMGGTAPAAMGGTDMMTPDQVAAATGLTRDTLKTYRNRGTGPSYVKLGHKTVRYQRRDVDDWIAAARKTTGKTPPGQDDK
jgi:predicted DNA-binding transcriptional regulator AlpA/uncharacterized protein YegL